MLLQRIHTHRKWLVPEPSDLFNWRCAWFLAFGFLVCNITATSSKYEYLSIGIAGCYWYLREKHETQRIGIERKYILINSNHATCKSSKCWKTRIFATACVYKTEQSHAKKERVAVCHSQNVNWVQARGSVTWRGLSGCTQAHRADQSRLNVT